ncbi:hypothetical protein C9439_07650 [archaeon SCG-AAA382B04]|nr:hypothetical protein C9439_07650 [archaeon SCG-AAA382B04]
MSTPTKQIGSIDFGLLSQEEIRKMSVTKIITPDTYDDDGYPIEMGLMDRRLGVIDPGLECKTCGGRPGECPGHFGRIELAAPVIHVGYARNIRKILRATCRECGKLLLSETKKEEYLKEIQELKDMKEPTEDIVREVLKEARKTKECMYCGEEQIDIDFEKPSTFKEDDEKLTPTDVKEWLEKIPDRDTKVFGMDPEKARPEWLVLEVLPVPPVTIRPSITLESGQRSEDDLTHKLVDILRINQRFQENREAGAPQLVIEDLWELIQYHVTTFLDNEVSGIPPPRHRSGRTLKTLSQRLKGKEGRFRNDLSGKRVNFSARTVISPDPNIGINEVGVPEQIAKELTIPLEVTERNKQKAKEIVKRGPENHPGANYVRRSDGRKQKITEENRENIAKNVEVGWRIDRHLKNDDIVLFNRQPSLHRMSIMAHKVKVMPYKTFRLNLCVCVSGDTSVDCGGYTRPIAELSNNWENEKVTTYDPEEKEIRLTGLQNFWSLDPTEYGATVHKIKTPSETITATSDHPLQTKEGLKPVEELEKGDELLKKPIELPTFSPEENEQIFVRKEDIRHAVPDKSYTKHTIETLSHLLPFDIHSRKGVAAARLSGHLFGDGTLILDDYKARAVFWTQEKDLKKIREDLNLLGFDPEEPRKKQSNGTITQEDGSTLQVNGSILSFELRNKPFVSFMKALGVPTGEKTTTQFPVPDWVMDGPKAVKRAFLSAYFGSELRKPKQRQGKLFKQPVFKVAKTEEVLDSGKRFLSDIDKLLHEFGTGISNVRVDSGNRRKDGSISKTLTAELEANLKSLKGLFGRIGYTYNSSADSEARIAYAYLSEKQNELNRLKELAKRTRAADEYGEIKQIAGAQGRNTHQLYQWRSQSVEQPRPMEFPSFDEWKQKRIADEDEGLIWEEVTDIETARNQQVYDVTTVDEAHRFITNGFVGSNCPPYNADFDGDEMNLHVLQGEEARAEAELLMKVQTQMLSPRFGAPIIGGIHDHISGSYIMTRKGQKFNKDDAIELLRRADKFKLPEPDGEEDGQEYWTGKTIFSQILPDDLNMAFKGSHCKNCAECDEEECEDEAYVKIEDGELKSGAIDEKAFGAFSGKILDRIIREYGVERAVEFLNDVTRIAVRAITKLGFSIGIEEEDLPEKAEKQISTVIEKAEKEVDKLVDTYERGELEPIPGRSIEETLEMKVMQTLGNARDKAGDIASNHLGLDNSGVVMAVSGARGSMLNLTQMTGAVGQQSVRGERINRGYEERTLANFKKNDLGADARGFVHSSYKQGLTPTEFFFHSMGGREGLVDTAVRTAQSGYMQRRLINALQDLKIGPDGTVRNTADDIIQFDYGEDGINPTTSHRGEAVDLDDVINKVREEK